MRKAAERPLAPGLYHLRFRTVSSDGSVSKSDIYELGGKPLPDARIVATNHGVRSERGVLSGNWWQRDANGLVLPEARSLTVFDRVLRSTMHPPDGRVRVLGITRTLPHRYVLEIAPNSRIVQRRYIDAATFLTTEIVTRDYDGTEKTTDYSDYVRVWGLPIPSRESQHSNLSGQIYQTSLLSYRRIPPNPALVAIPHSRAPFVPQTSLPATVNSLFSKYGILIRADIEGNPYWLKLDSGAGDIVLDHDLVLRLGLHEFGKSVGAKGGRLSQALAVLPRIDIGPVYATNLVIESMPSDDMEDGVEVVGLLGCDFIASRPLAIDFRQKTVTEIAAPPPSTDRSWTILRTPLRGCRPTINARLANRAAALLLDFGSPNTVVNEDVLDAITPRPTVLDRKPIEFLGRDRLLGTEYAILNASAGDLNLAPIVVTVVDGARAQDLDDDGFVGRNVLDEYSLVLDYVHQRTYFRKYADPNGEQ